MTKLRTMTGICAQQNVLFDDLTAWEHLMLFCGIKGVSDKDHKRAVHISFTFEAPNKQIMTYYVMKILG